MDRTTERRSRRRTRSVPGQRPLTVADLMKRNVVTISPDASLLDLIRALRDHEIGGMPVCDETGEVVGTVSSTDLLWLADSIAVTDHAGGFLPPSALATRTVRDIMTPDVFGVAPDSNLADLRRFFARTGVQRALVLDGGKVIGIVVLSDVLGTLVP